MIRNVAVEVCDVTLNLFSVKRLIGKPCEVAEVVVVQDVVGDEALVGVGGRDRASPRKNVRERAEVAALRLAPCAICLAKLLLYKGARIAYDKMYRNAIFGRVKYGF